MSDDELFELCVENRDLRIERTADGELIIMPPTGGKTGARNASLTTQLGNWVDAHDGISFDSSTGFILPNGAERSPDAAWLSRERWDALTDAQREKFVPLCPDFVVELRSPSDSSSDVEAKLDEYLACGAKLGWLIEPQSRTVSVYRPGRPVEKLEAPEALSADPELPGFTLRFDRIW